MRASKDDCVGIYIYMLRCADGYDYVGSATGHDLSPRIDHREAGSYPGYTFSRRPVVLVWSEYFDRITDGIAVERQIKGWSRVKKEALIRTDWTNLVDNFRRRGEMPEGQLSMSYLRGSPKRLAPQDDVSYSALRSNG